MIPGGSCSLPSFTACTHKMSCIAIAASLCVHIPCPELLTYSIIMAPVSRNTGSFDCVNTPFLIQMRPEYFNLLHTHCVGEAEKKLVAVGWGRRLSLCSATDLMCEFLSLAQSPWKMMGIIIFP